MNEKEIILLISSNAVSLCVGYYFAGFIQYWKERLGSVDIKSHKDY